MMLDPQPVSLPRKPRPTLTLVAPVVSDAKCYRAVNTSPSYAAAARKVGLSVYRVQVGAKRHAQAKGMAQAQPMPRGRRAYELREQSLQQGEALTWSAIGRLIDHSDPLLLARSWALSPKNGRPWPIPTPTLDVPRG